jgi:hypothetical protein
MSAMKPWHLLVLLFLVAGPLFGYLRRDSIERKGWVMILLIGLAFFMAAAVAGIPVFNAAGLFAVTAGVVGAITTKNVPR